MQETLTNLKQKILQATAEKENEMKIYTIQMIEKAKSRWKTGDGNQQSSSGCQGLIRQRGWGAQSQQKIIPRRTANDNDGHDGMMQSLQQQLTGMHSNATVYTATTTNTGANTDTSSPSDPGTGCPGGLTRGCSQGALYAHLGCPGNDTWTVSWGSDLEEPWGHPGVTLEWSRGDPGRGCFEGLTRGYSKMKSNNGGEAGGAIETAVCGFFPMAIAAFIGNHAYL